MDAILSYDSFMYDMKFDYGVQAAFHGLRCYYYIIIIFFGYFY